MKVDRRGISLGFYQALHDKTSKNYFSNKAKKLVEAYWISHFRFWSSSIGAIDEDGLCQCVASEDPFDQPDLRYFLFVSTFFDQLIHYNFKEIYSEFRATYKFPKIYVHEGEPYDVMAHPSCFLSYDRKDLIIIKNNFEILLMEILQFFSSKKLQGDRLVNHIKHNFEDWYSDGNNILNDFLRKEGI